MSTITTMTAAVTAVINVTARHGLCVSDGCSLGLEFAGRSTFSSLGCPDSVSLLLSIAVFNFGVDSFVECETKSELTSSDSNSFAFEGRFITILVTGGLHSFKMDTSQYLLQSHLLQ